MGMVLKGRTGLLKAQMGRDGTRRVQKKNLYHLPHPSYHRQWPFPPDQYLLPPTQNSLSLIDMSKPKARGD